MPQIPSRAAAVWPRDGAARRREPRGPQPGPTAADAPGPPRASPRPPRAASRTPAAALPVRSLPSSRPAAPRSPASTGRLPDCSGRARPHSASPQSPQKRPSPSSGEKKKKSLLSLSSSNSSHTLPGWPIGDLPFPAPLPEGAAHSPPPPRHPYRASPRYTSRALGPLAWPHSRRRLTSAAPARAPAAEGSGAPLPAAGACSGWPD